MKIKVEGKTELVERVYIEEIKEGGAWILIIDTKDRWVPWSCSVLWGKREVYIYPPGDENPLEPEDWARVFVEGLPDGELRALGVQDKDQIIVGILPVHGEIRGEWKSQQGEKK